MRAVTNVEDLGVIARWKLPKAINDRINSPAFDEGVLTVQTSMQLACVTGVWWMSQPINRHARLGRVLGHPRVDRSA